MDFSLNYSVFCTSAFFCNYCYKTSCDMIPYLVIYRDIPAHKIEDIRVLYFRDYLLDSQKPGQFYAEALREMLKLMWTCAAVSMNESSSTLLHSSTWTINCNFLLATVIRINVTQMVFRPNLSWRTRTTPIAEQNRFYSPIHKHKSLRISKHGGFRTAPSKLDMDILPSKTHHVS